VQPVNEPIYGDEPVLVASAAEEPIDTIDSVDPAASSDPYYAQVSLDNDGVTVADGGVDSVAPAEAAQPTEVYADVEQPVDTVDTVEEPAMSHDAYQPDDMMASSDDFGAADDFGADSLA
jgi:hypothetical protein